MFPIQCCFQLGMWEQIPKLFCLNTSVTKNFENPASRSNPVLEDASLILRKRKNQPWLLDLNKESVTNFLYVYTRQ